MNFGIHFLDVSLPESAHSLSGCLRRTVHAVEASGAHGLTGQDHFLQMEQFRSAHDPMPESAAALEFLTAITERAQTDDPAAYVVRFAERIASRLTNVSVASATIDRAL